MKEVRGEKIILGIDPGTTITGYGLISVTGKTPSLITLGIIDLRKKTDHFQKIRTVFEETLALIDRYHPDEFAIEAQFFGKNIQSMLKLGRAQGAAISAALYRGSAPPREVCLHRLQLRGPQRQGLPQRIQALGRLPAPWGQVRVRGQQPGRIPGGLPVVADEQEVGPRRQGLFGPLLRAWW